MRKDETGTLSYTTHKNQLKLINDLKVKTKNCKPPRSKHGDKLFDIHLDNDFLDLISRAKEIKAKINK